MSKLVRVNTVERITDKAIAIKDTKGEIVWLPKSQCTITLRHTITEIEIPNWLSEKYPDLEVEDV